MKKIIKLILLVVISSLLITSCGGKTGNSLADIKDRGNIVMYTEAGFPPFAYRGNAGSIEGIDMDISLEIAKEIGVALNTQDVKFTTLIPSLTGGKADFVAAGMTNTEERSKKVDFSNNYLVAYQSVLSLEGKGYQKISELSDKKIGVQTGSTSDIIVSAEAKNVKLEDGTMVDGIFENTGTEIKRYETVLEAVQDLKNGRIDAIVVGSIVGENLISNNLDINDEKLLDRDGKEYSESNAIAVKKGNTELLDIINKVLARLEETGKLDEIYKKHAESIIKN
ncbi:MAG: amino acid ABC transporter substrate-binding protein [Oscillospiraceae bacterium]|nr:amino acid ABC transporter substrate-binding protein [Oscillospiraceae bacterium]